jgi:hypothetical protein
LSPLKNVRVFEKCLHYAENFTAIPPAWTVCGRTGSARRTIPLHCEALDRQRLRDCLQAPDDALAAGERALLPLRSGEPYLDNLLGCDLLIVDDLGAEFATSFTAPRRNLITNSG